MDLPPHYGGNLDRFNRITSHNSYVSFLAETGLLGAVPFGALLLYLAARGLQAAVLVARRGEYWALGLYVAFVTMGVHLWVLAGLTGTSTWIVYGLVAGMIERSNRPSCSGTVAAQPEMGRGFPSSQPDRAQNLPESRQDKSRATDSGKKRGRLYQPDR
jgi:O-antigen ligase